MTRMLILGAAAALLALSGLALRAGPQAPPAAAAPLAQATNTIPPPAATPTPPGGGPTAVPTSGVVVVQCDFIRGRVPDAVIASALANPQKVYGYNQPRNPNVPPGRYNLPRTHLSLMNTHVPYHPLFNTLVFKPGCP